MVRRLIPVELQTVQRRRRLAGIERLDHDRVREPPAGAEAEVWIKDG